MVYLSDQEKIDVLERSNRIFSLQIQMGELNRQFMQISERLRVESEALQSVKLVILDKYGCVGGTIGNDYSINPPA